MQSLPNFIKKLLQILQDKKNYKIVCWLQKGQGFHVIDQHKFQTNLLPFYYRHNNMASFVRQLNMYGFHKHKEGSFSFYSHQYFHRDHEQLMFKISRKPQKKIHSSHIVSKQKQNFEFTQINNQEKKKQQFTLNRKNKKKVCFEPLFMTKKDSSVSQLEQKKKNNILSQVSLKYRCSNIKSEKSIQLQCEQKCNDQPKVNAAKSCVSIAEEVEKQFSKNILWGPSQILDI